LIALKVSCFNMLNDPKDTHKRRHDTRHNKWYMPSQDTSKREMKQQEHKTNSTRPIKEKL
jgi:hypothetical protein